MSFNSKQYFAYEDRRLQPDTVLIKGNHKWHQPVIVQRAKVAEPLPDYRREAEIEKMEDEYLKQHGII